ncbi:MAG: hypothetical protein Ct9H300mP3_01730 [Gammaproteobacteria bacterium]|nr:MAG: hypothetical protein Ct9H300mP3_01730 [Gammaproteobacteria bacterium]
MDEGILVSDEVIVGVVVDRIAKKDCESGFLFDGYPRTIPQAKALDVNSVEINLVIEMRFRMMLLLIGCLEGECI